jgi:BlaI family transcriptional regulator, penicillinase repressor
VAASAKQSATGVLTRLELEIMHVLWNQGPSTVNEVRETLPSDLAYTTVQTMLNVLLRKKKVRRSQVGRAYRYQPSVSRQGAMGSALQDLVARMFGGSSEALLMALIDTRQITAEQIERASRMLDEAGDQGGANLMKVDGERDG